MPDRLDSRSGELGSRIEELGCIDRAEVLIIRGINSTDELASLGLPFAERYQAAESVILVSDGRGREVKGHSMPGSIQFIDADSRLDSIASLLERISDEYQRAHPQHAHLSHCHVGKLLMFGHAERSGRPVSVMDLIHAGDIDSVRKVVEHYIDSGFESLYLRESAISDGDGGHRDPASTDAHAQATSDPGADGVG